MEKPFEALSFTDKSQNELAPMNPQNAVANIEHFFSRYYPDPIVFTIGLTFLTFAACIAATPLGPVDAVIAWGDGLSNLLSFMAQIGITLLLSHALTNTAPVAAALRAFASVPKSPAQAYILVAIISAGLSLITGALGLIGGAILARSVGKAAHENGMSVHYPLLVATAYAGVSVWHMGYSGSAPLFVATTGHSLEAAIGVIPVTETTYTVWNGAALMCTIMILCLTAVFLHPKKSPQEPAEINEDNIRETLNESGTPAASLDNARIITLSLAALLIFYLAIGIFNGKLSIDLNTINWSLLIACLIFARSPISLVHLMSRAGPVVAPVLLHYPFYAGMMALMMDSGLVSLLSAGMVNFASAETLPFLAFLAAGFLNIFVPSGGGQWVVQGPVFIEAAQTLNVAPEHIVMAIAYGDQWTNLLQPFWALPVLAIAGLQVRDIIGYCFCFLITMGLAFGVSLLFIAQF